MKKIIFIILLVLLFVFVGCNSTNNEQPKKETKLQYDSEVHVGDIVHIEIIEGEDRIIALETDNLDLFDIDDNNVVKAIKKGVGVITVILENSDDQVITINISPAPKPTIDFVITENPEVFKVGVTYHYEVNIAGKDGATYNIIKYSDDIVLDEENKTILFKATGKKNIDCFIVGDRGIHDDVYFDVMPNKEIEYYSIMYIGNSFTYYMDIPLMVQTIIEEHCPYVSIKRDLVGGQYLHDALDKYLTDFDGEYFTHVILQEQSGNAVTNFSDFRQSILDYCEKIDRTETEIILYQTWVDSVGTSNANRTRQNQIIKAYGDVGTEIGARVIRVGEAFWKANDYDIVPYLYIDDNHHQNIYGAYLSACMHYHTLTGRRASDTTYIPSGISEEVAKVIRSIADSFYE